MLLVFGNRAVGTRHSKHQRAFFARRLSRALAFFFTNSRLRSRIIFLVMSKDVIERLDRGAFVYRNLESILRIQAFHAREIVLGKVHNFG